jgi:hypothetical protein
MNILNRVYKNFCYPVRPKLSRQLQSFLCHFQRRFHRSRNHFSQNRVYEKLAIQLVLNSSLVSASFSGGSFDLRATFSRAEFKQNFALKLALISSLTSASFRGSFLDIRAMQNIVYEKFCSPISPETSVFCLPVFSGGVT